MSWGISFNIQIDILREDYQENIQQVEDAIEEYKQSLEDCKRLLCMYSTGATLEFDKELADDKVQYLFNKLHTLFEDINELNIKIYKLTLYKEYLENKQNEGEVQNEK